MAVDYAALIREGRLSAEEACALQGFERNRGIIFELDSDQSNRTAFDGTSRPTVRFRTADGRYTAFTGGPQGRVAGNDSLIAQFRIQNSNGTHNEFQVSQTGDQRVTYFSQGHRPDGEWETGSTIINGRPQVIEGRTRSNAPPSQDHITLDADTHNCAAGVAAAPVRRLRTIAPT